MVLSRSRTRPEAAGLVGDEIAPPADQRAQFGERIILEDDRPEIGGAQTELIGDNAPVLGVALWPGRRRCPGGRGLRRGRAHARAVRVDQHGADQGGDAAQQVDADADLQGSLHPLAPSTERPLPAANTLKTAIDRPEYSGRAKVAGRATMRPSSWSSANEAIPAPPPR